MCRVVQSVILTCHLLKPACIYGGDSAFSFCSILIMQNQGFLHQEALFHSVGKISGQLQLGHPMKVRQLFTDRTIIHSCHLVALQSQAASAVVVVHEASQLKFSKIKSTMNENVDELSYDDDDELCPVECVREFKTDEEFSEIMEKAKESNALVVVDFYRTSCGSCKYIEQGFIKLCKGSGLEESPVVFLKHNVIDEYDEQSEVADRLRIRSVPLFHFYKNGVLLEAFATRDKVRILDAITKYTAPSSSLQVDSVS